ncbi:hypothetical protein WJX79_001779 [Trebouxia sp. C0005]
MIKGVVRSSEVRVPDLQANTRCSKCKKVSFCNTECQRKGFTVHRYHCQSTQDQQFSIRLQPLLHQAVAAPSNSADPPYPPSLKHLMDIADKQPTGRDEKMLAAYSNVTVARYFLHHAAVPLAWRYLEAALASGKELKVWSIQNDALQYQIMMCRHLDQDILQSMVDCCKEGLRSGSRHHDLNLQAQASHALGGMEALYHPPEGFRLLQQSREMWSNLMKAAWTWADGNVEDTSIMTCAANLVKVLINIAGSLTTRGKAVESEAVLREALLYKDYTGDPLVEFDVLLALANNLELHEESMPGPGFGERISSSLLCDLLTMTSS